MDWGLVDAISLRTASVTLNLATAGTANWIRGSHDGMFDMVVGSVLGVCWACAGRVLGVCWACAGRVLGIRLACFRYICFTTH